MKEQNLLFVYGVAPVVFAALMLFACDDGAVVIGPGPGFPGSPTAVASADPITGDSPLTVTLSAAGSSDPDGTIVRWQWDFENDGTYDWSSTTSGTITHEYPAGEYTAKLLVTDDSGKSAIATVEGIFSNPWMFETVASWKHDSGYSPEYSFVFINPVSSMPCVVYGIYYNGAYKGLAYASKDDSGNWQSYEYDLPLKEMTEPVVFGDGSIGLGVQTTEVSGNIGFLERSAAGVWSLNRIDSVTNPGVTRIQLAYDTGGDIYLMYSRGGSSYNVAVYSDSVWTLNEAGNDVFALAGVRAFTCFEGSIYTASLESGNILTIYNSNQSDRHVDTRININGLFLSAKLQDIEGILMLFESEIYPSRLTCWRKSSNEWTMTDLTGIIRDNEFPRSGLYQLYAFKNGSAVSLAFTTSTWVGYIGDITNPDLERFAYGSAPISVHAAYGDDHKTYVCYSGNSNKEVILATKK